MAEIGGVFYGCLDLPWWGNVVYLLVCTHLTIVGVTVFLHRSQAHRALDLHPIVSHPLRLWLWLTTGMNTKAWVAIHRKHHAKCDTSDDPHSPQILGLPMVLWQGAELYKIEAHNKQTLDRFGQGTPDDWLEKNIYTPLSTLGYTIMLITNIGLLGVPGIAVWAIQMMWIPFFAAGVINGVGHYFGYRNFECPDAATNIVPLGLLIGGEELHNNHHTYPTSAKLSVKWWEFDIGWFYIRLLASLGLAKVKRLPPQVKLEANKHIDVETLRAVLTNRFQVMAEYTKEVIMPVFKQQRRLSSNHDKGILTKVKTALFREKLLVADSVREDLEAVLAKQQHHKLRSVYQLGKKLQDIWDTTTASQKELLDALHDWCIQAEQTGIKCLQDFVVYLQGYQIIRKVT